MSVEPDTTPNPTLITIKRVLIGILILLIAQALYFAQDVAMPIVLGVLIALTLRPIVRFGEKRRVPAGLSSILIILGLGTGLVTAAYTLSEPVSQMVASAPEMASKIRLKFAGYMDEIEAVQSASEQVGELTSGGDSAGVQRVVVQQPGLLTAAASNFFSGITTFLVALVLAMFLLSTGTLFYEKIVAIMPLLSEKKRALRVIYDVERQVSRYLLTITMINIGLGAVIATSLTLYGMPNAIMWGCIAAVFNFLPFIGALAGTVMIAATAIVFYPTLGAALVVPAIYLACTMVEGNVVTPMIVGRRLELNIVAVLLTVTIWGWLWGLMGALMAVPILVAVKVFCDNFESLQGFGHFLSERPQILPDEDETPAQAGAA